MGTFESTVACMDVGGCRRGRLRVQSHAWMLVVVGGAFESTVACMDVGGCRRGCLRVLSHHSHGCWWL